MTARLTVPQVLAWRLERHYLDPVRPASVPAVVDRLGGIQAQVASSADLAIRVRRATSRPGDTQRALADGRIIKTWAMRGALHLVTPDLGSALLAVLTSARPWERPSWQKYFGLTPPVLERLREAVGEILEGRVLTREELVDEISTRQGLAHLGEGLRSGWGTLLKPLAWNGELCFGPSRGSRVTFMRPADASRHWRGLPAIEEAAPRAVEAYLGAYGPATVTRLGGWLAGGWFGTRVVRSWFDALGDRVTTVEVDGSPAIALTRDLDALTAARPSATVRLLPGFDQWVLGPGTGDGQVTPSARRPAVSRVAGWISPVVVVGGVVRGTWELEADGVKITWFAEGGRVPRGKLAAEVERLGGILGRDLGSVVTTA
jgi:hypothetical protein